MATSGSNSAHEQSQVWQIWEYETNSLRTLKKSHPAIVRRRSILVPRAYNPSGLWALDPNHSPEGSSALGTRMAEIEQASEGARIFFALPPSFDPFAYVFGNACQAGQLICETVEVYLLARSTKPNFDPKRVNMQVMITQSTWIFHEI